MLDERKSIFIEISSREVRFLYWERAFWSKNSKLDSYVFPLGHQPDNKQLVEVLTDFRKRYLGNKKISAYLLIPLQMGLIREFKLPWIPKKKRETAIGYYIEHEIPVPPGELVYYYQELEEKENEYLKIRVSAARREIISKYADCLIKAGYKLEGIEYAVNCVGMVLGKLGDKRVLVLQESKEGRIQLGLYRGSMLEVTTEIGRGERDVAKIMFSLRSQDEVLPIEMVVSDGSTQADELASLLHRSGLIIDHQLTPEFDEEQLDILNIQGLKVYATCGYLLKIKKGKQANLYSSFLIPLKLKALALTGGIFLTILLLLGTLIWYPLYADYTNSQTRINDLQMNIANLEAEQSQDILTDWRILEEKSYQDLEQLYRALSYVDKEVTLERLNYKQGTLNLWAEGRDNPSITKLTDKLMADGWQDPELINYKYYQQTISFCLSVNR